MSQQISVPCGIAIPQVFQDTPVDMGLVTEYVQNQDDQYVRNQLDQLLEGMSQGPA